MQTLAYYNGKIAEIEEMMIPMNDRASWFGDGCYDATYSRNHVIYCLDAHLDRFYNSARLLEIEMPMPKEEMAALLCDLVKRVDSGDQFVYMQVTRGTAPRGHAYGDKPLQTNLWITLTPHGIEDTYEPISAILCEDRRFYFCNIKTLNLLPNVLAAEKARKAGAGEAIFYRPSPDGDIRLGRVTECAHSNIHILQDGVFRTAPTDSLILPGIARANLIRVCRTLGIPVSEEPFTVEELLSADEVIHSSSGSFCVPVNAIDATPVGGRDPHTLRRIQDALVADWLAATN